MKKSKNENVAENNVKTTEHRRKNRVTENSSAERTREKDNEKNFDFPFKKVLYGYDPEEVSAYIKEVGESNKSALHIQQSKLSSMQEELVLSNRERDSFREKYKSCKAKLEEHLTKAPEPVVVEKIIDNSAEYEAELVALRNELEILKTENFQLKQFVEKNSDDAFEEYVSKIAALEAEKNEFKSQVDLLNQKNSELLLGTQKYDELFEEHKSVIAKLELSKVNVTAKKNEIVKLNEKITEKVEELNAVSDENEQIKKKLAESEIKNTILIKQVSEKEEELIDLKEINKTQAYDYAKKINTLEHENSKAKLALQKELQLHNYHISQAELVLSEMTKQMDQIKQSFNDIQSV